MSEIERYVQNLRARLSENAANGWSRRERAQLVAVSIYAVDAISDGKGDGAVELIELALEHEAAQREPT